MCEGRKNNGTQVMEHVAWHRQQFSQQPHKYEYVNLDNTVVRRNRYTTYWGSKGMDISTCEQHCHSALHTAFRDIGQSQKKKLERLIGQGLQTLSVLYLRTCWPLY